MSDTTEYDAKHSQSSTPPKGSGPLLRVNEIFGPTFQGEGRAAGRHSLFVRLYDCNLTCSWCDTSYTWANTPARAEQHRTKVLFNRKDEEHLMTTDDVMDRLNKLWPVSNGVWESPKSPTVIVFSGGEPMMQQKELEPLVASLALSGNEVHVETAGTIEPRELFNRYVKCYTVSPKLANSGNRESKRYKPDVLRWFAQEPNAYFKFVVAVTSDLEEVDQIVLDCHINPQVVQIMPEGTTPHGIMTRAIDLADAVLRRGYGMSLRNHILIWADERGK